jgi:hypothetical protein
MAAFESGKFIVSPMTSVVIPFSNTLVSYWMFFSGEEHESIKIPHANNRFVIFIFYLLIISIQKKANYLNITKFI